MEILIQPVKIYSQDIGMEFGRDKSAWLIMKRGKRQVTEGIETKECEDLPAFKIALRHRYNDSKTT